MKISPLAILACVLALLTGCDKPAADPSAKPVDAKTKGTIGVSLLTLDNPFFKVIGDNITAEGKKRGYDAIVLVIDQDNAPERVQEITMAQNNQLVALPRALGVAIRTFDAWMLADEQALTRVLGYAVSPQRSPEDVSDAKGVCTQLLGKSPMAMSQSEFYASVAREADMSTLTRQCSKGFAPFAQRVRSL